METCLIFLGKENADVMALDKETKTKVIEDYARHEGDTGSPEVQVALLTNRITTLTDHLRANKHDESSRRGLLKLVGQRRRLLSYIRRKDYQRYMALTERLNIRRK
jgi:small subunit ribosomal protein S15